MTPHRAGPAGVGSCVQESPNTRSRCTAASCLSFDGAVTVISSFPEAVKKERVRSFELRSSIWSPAHRTRLSAAGGNAVF